VVSKHGLEESAGRVLGDRLSHLIFIVLVSRSCDGTGVFQSCS
jgi:hypothetical protein